MKRLDINSLMMQTALMFAKRSTCARIKTGAVITIDDHIVSTGYNGVPAGHTHCEDHFRSMFEYEDEFVRYLSSEAFLEEHKIFSNNNELHAEMNAIIYASRIGTPIYGGSIYTVYSPCLFCAKSIIQAGIKRVFYYKKYDRSEQDSINLLEFSGIEVSHIENV